MKNRIYALKPVRNGSSVQWQRAQLAGAPQIVWSPVPGATGYIYEIMTGNIPGCCNRPVGIISNTVYTTFYDIPANLPCFRFRVRAIIPYCENTPWSDYYTYCPQQIVCTPVITVCGCCHGERSGAETGFDTRVVSEEEMLAFLNAHPGTEYPTLQEALNAAGVVATTEPEFAVFPNPANEYVQLQIDLPEVLPNVQVRLLNVLGAEVLRQDIGNVQAQTVKLPVAHLPAGTYLLQLTSGSLQLSRKIVIE